MLKRTALSPWSADEETAKADCPAGNPNRSVPRDRRDAHDELRARDRDLQLVGAVRAHADPCVRAPYTPNTSHAHGPSLRRSTRGRNNLKTPRSKTPRRHAAGGVFKIYQFTLLRRALHDASAGFDDRIGDITRNFLVMAKLHGVACAALRDRTE